MSVARVAQRYAMNANLISKWLRDPRHSPQRRAEPDAACFLPVEIVDRPLHDDDCRNADYATHSAGRIEIDIAGGHPLRIFGGYDPEALSRLIRGLFQRRRRQHAR